MPDLPAASDYEVFIKYTASGTRATDAQYTIVHSTGSVTIPVNQTQNGGIWQSLGTYTFDAGTGGSVSVEASENGTISADAVRFVAESAPPGEIAYILTDHLGTPQKLVDASKAVIWDRQQTPFGITHAETASPARSTNVRFPGQWADAETGLSYNYFRTYDPTMGRYIQSDPIGLGGGLNTYGYVGGNPVTYVDYFGLACTEISSFVVWGLEEKYGEKVIEAGRWILTHDSGQAMQSRRTGMPGTRAICAAIQKIVKEVTYIREGTKVILEYCEDCEDTGLRIRTEPASPKFRTIEVPDWNRESAHFALKKTETVSGKCNKWLQLLNQGINTDYIM